MEDKSKNREVNYLDRENLIDTWKKKKWSRANWKIKTNQTEEKTWAEKIGNEWITKTQEVSFLKGKERLARFNRKKNTLCPGKKGSLPENMNFGIKPSVVKTFLQSNGVKYKTSNKKIVINKVKIAEEGVKQTLYLECMIRKDKLAKIKKETDKRN